MGITSVHPSLDVPLGRAITLLNHGRKLGQIAIDFAKILLRDLLPLYFQRRFELDPKGLELLLIHCGTPFLMVFNDGQRPACSTSSTGVLNSSNLAAALCIAGHCPFGSRFNLSDPFARPCDLM